MLPGERQQFEQLGVVVEHLLEMRHQPFLVHGIARETSAEMIVNPAFAHSFERMFHGFKEAHIIRAQPRAPQAFPGWRVAEISVRRACRH